MKQHWNQDQVVYGKDFYQIFKENILFLHKNVQFQIFLRDQLLSVLTTHTKKK